MPGQNGLYTGHNRRAGSLSGMSSGGSVFVPPVDVYLQNTTAGAGADNRVDLTNWLTPSQNATHALNATDYAAVANHSNTVTGAAVSGDHLSTSGLITNAGWTTMGGAFKKSAGNALFVSLQEGSDNTNYSVFDLTLGTVSNTGSCVGTCSSLGNGWWWCSIVLAAQAGNKTFKWHWADSAAHAVPGTVWTSTTGDILLAGPFAGI